MKYKFACNQLNPRTFKGAFINYHHMKSIAGPRPDDILSSVFADVCWQGIWWQCSNQTSTHDWQLIIKDPNRIICLFSPFILYTKTYQYKPLHKMFELSCVSFSLVSLNIMSLWLYNWIIAWQKWHFATCLKYGNRLLPCWLQKKKKKIRSHRCRSIDKFSFACGIERF